MRARVTRSSTLLLVGCEIYLDLHGSYVLDSRPEGLLLGQVLRRLFHSLQANESNADIERSAGLPSFPDV
jgi:hypothetical protein